MLLKEDVAHGFDELVSIIECVLRYVSTRVVIIRIPCCTKPDSGVRQLSQTFLLLPTKPILALVCEAPHTALKPSLLQLCCSEAWEPISVFHMLRPSKVAQ